MSRPRVVRSINAPAGDRCVDLFLRADRSYGFEEYRRDPEDPRGWYPVGHFAGQTFAWEDEALVAARRAIPWLDDLTP